MARSSFFYPAADLKMNNWNLKSPGPGLQVPVAPGRGGGEIIVFNLKLSGPKFTERSVPSST